MEFTPVHNRTAPLILVAAHNGNINSNGDKCDLRVAT
jgi:hypothetical protein